MRALRAALAGALVVLMWGPPARSAEPVTVTVEGVVPLTEETRENPRARAFEAALVEAVVAVALPWMPTLEPGAEQEQEQALALALGPTAPSSVLTYRIDGSGRERPSSEDPRLQEYVLTMTVTVDAAQVRARVEELGLLEGASRRPSLLFQVGVLDDETRAAEGALVALESYVKRRLADDGYVVVEPALRAPGLADGGTALETARALGVDVSVDVVARWLPRSAQRVPGGVMEMQVRAVRVEDGSDVAIARFEAPGYHADLAEAQVRAAEALQEQVSGNLLLQLDRNWEALDADSPAVRVVLSGVRTLLQVDLVSDALLNQLGAEQVELRRISPRSVELEVTAPLSAGALQERLATVPFDGFQLEPVQVAVGRVELRVAGVAERGSMEGRPLRESPAAPGGSP